MTTAFTRRTWGSSLLIAGMVIPAVAVGGSAFAAPTCAATTPAATLIAPGICEVVVTASGTFTPPVGVSKVAAVLVGGGAGGYHYGGGYGGGGGEVVYVDSVAVAAPLAIVVGAGGTYGFKPGGGDNTPATNGGSTTLSSFVARGGVAGSDFHGGASGSALQGFMGCPGPGGGSRSVATETAPGAGYTFEQISGLDAALFPMELNPETEFGQGGGETTIAPDPGTGGGGGYVDSGPTAGAFDGASGSVTFRFAATEAAASPDGDELAATGANDAALLAGVLGLGLMVAGAAVVAQPRRTATRLRSGKA